MNNRGAYLFLSVVALLLPLIVTRVCSAQLNTPVMLEWEAPEGCPQRVQVENQIRRLLETSSEVKLGSSLFVQGAIRPLGERYRLTLQIETDAVRGVRRLESDDCTSLGKAAAVVIALLVTKERLLGHHLSSREFDEQVDLQVPPVRAENKVRPLSVDGASKSGATSASRSWRFLFRVPTASLAWGTLPDMGYGLGVGAGLRWEKWAVFTELSLYDTDTVSSSSLQQYQVIYHRWLLDTSLCRYVNWGGFGLAPCAKFAFNNISAHASGPGFMAEDRSAFGGLIGVGLAASINFSKRMSLVATGAGRLTLNRGQFLVNTMNGQEQVYEMPWANLDVSLACEWFF